MHDYMKALYGRFYRPTEQVKELKEEARNSYRELSERLEKPERRLLLELVDLEDNLRSHVCVGSFAAGYKLAHGIHQELLPPYDFQEEEERRANSKLKEEE